MFAANTPETELVVAIEFDEADELVLIGELVSVIYAGVRPEQLVSAGRDTYGAR